MHITYEKLQKDAAESGNWSRQSPAEDREFLEARSNMIGFLSMYGEQNDRQTVTIEWGDGTVLTPESFATREAILEWFDDPSGIVTETSPFDAADIWQKGFAKRPAPVVDGEG